MNNKKNNHSSQETGSDRELPFADLEDRQTSSDDVSRDNIPPDWISALRDVTAPSELKDQLRQIPHRHSLDNSTVESATPAAPAPEPAAFTPSRVRRQHLSKWVLGMAIAATLAGIFLVANWDWIAGTDSTRQPLAKSGTSNPSTSIPGKSSSQTTGGGSATEGQNTEDKGTEDKGTEDRVVTPGIDSTPDTTNAFAEMAAALERKLEIARLRKRVAQLRREQSRKRSRQLLTPEERVALTMAIADQSVVSLSGSTELAKADLQLVRNRYPGTLGAEIATSFLNEIASDDFQN